MEYHRILSDFAMTQYRRGDFGEAVLSWSEARDLARQSGDLPSWYACTVWSAEALRVVGELQKALTLVLEARYEEPHGRPSFEAWLGRKICFDVVLECAPAKESLDEQLEKMTEFASEHAVPAGDLLEVENDYLRAKGDFEGALRAIELSWQRYDGQGYVRYRKAVSGVLNCLALGQVALARDWLRALEGCRDGLVREPTSQAEMAILVALAEQRTGQELVPLLRRFEQAASDHYQPVVAARLRECAVRVWLLASPIDPMAVAHPAMAEIRRRARLPGYAEYSFTRMMLFLDYRLAALRFGVGMPAVDDLFYQQGQIFSLQARLDGDECSRRLSLARSAIRRARRVASRLDGALGCDWRAREVGRREQRADEIAEAMTGRPHPSRMTRGGGNGDRGRLRFPDLFEHVRDAGVASQEGL